MITEIRSDARHWKRKDEEYYSLLKYIERSVIHFLI